MCRESKQPNRTFLTGGAACALAFGAMTAYSGITLAQQSSASPKPLQTRAVVARAADLERTFWVCDYVATTHGADAAPVDLCIAAFDAFKDLKFGGDFEALLSWWRRNKAAEHQKLAIAAEQVAGN
jgi:hypothetical protein